MENTPGTRDRTVRLLKYLKEVVSLRSTSTRRIDSYEKEGKVLWFGAMPQDRECFSPAWAELKDGSSDLWLEIRKQTLPARPEADEILRPWIEESDLNRFRDEEPELNDSALLPTPPPGEPRDSLPDPSLPSDAPAGEPGPPWSHSLEDHPEVTRAWEAYLPSWRAWAAECRRKNAIQHVYSELFRIHQQQKRVGEIFELVLGFGLLSWEGKKGPVQRHIVAARAELRFDTRRGVLSVHCPPPPRGADLQIETDMLDPSERPDDEADRALQQRLETIGDAVWDGETLDTALRAWTNSLHDEACFDPAIRSTARPATTPVVELAPALILRRRSERGMLRTYDQMIRQLENGNPVSFGMARLVDPLDDLDRPADAASPPDPEKRFFPLPANREQLEILERLDQRRGVLVQGPPGTGKSHTIANLICHLLATGQRVLVTSETERALKVVKDKIPPELKPLAVSLLGSDSTSFSELESSISGITQKYAGYTDGMYDRTIAELTADLEAHRQKSQDLEQRLRVKREEETLPCQTAGGAYAGTPSEIARRVSTERDGYSWCTLPATAKESPPLTDSEAIEYLELLRDFSPEEEQTLSLVTVSLDEIPTPEEFALAVHEERRAEDDLEQCRQWTSHQAYAPLFRSDPEVRRKLRTDLETVIANKSSLKNRGYTWVDMALQQMLAQRESPWRILQEETRRKLQGLREAAHHADETRLEIPSDRDAGEVLHDAREMADHLARGGKWSLLGLPTGKARGKAYLRKEIRINGRVARSANDLENLVRCLETRALIDKLWRLWEPYEPGGQGLLQVQVGEIAELLEALDLAFETYAKCTDLEQEFAAQETRIPAPNWFGDEAQEWSRVLEAVELALRHADLKQKTETAVEALTVACATHDAHPINRALLECLQQRDTEGWSRAHAERSGIESRRRLLARRQELDAKFSSGAPEIAAAVRSGRNDKSWDPRLAELRLAWDWAHASRWVESRSHDEDRLRLLEERERLTKREEDILARLASRQAWKHFFARLTKEQSESLSGWREAVKGIGKGTGRSIKVERLRARAREYMSACQESIPAWILPRYRVAEMVEPVAERFDVVIVDEASQTGIDGLFLFHIAKKIIVVGDDQQISPTAGFVAEEEILALQRRYLDGIAHDVALRPESSLYGNANIRLDGKIVLREHFRCVPEIIGFSNELCYAPHRTPLDPLRPYPPDRLAPTIARYIPEGKRTGKARARNEAEAEALVAQVVGCARDERYRNKSFGVISLQGETQAKLIEGLLIEALGSEEMERRNLVCGDSYAFQGDERDVIFLSMVVAPNERFASLTKLPDRQRFNVAASRAKEQMWLFHSIQSHEAGASCVRRQLLDYFFGADRLGIEGNTGEPEQDLERDLDHHLHERGYLTRPQVLIGNERNRYRIDLLVEGAQGRLAIDCEGDRWDGPQRYHEETRRQMDLERAGWRFFRITGSAFYGSPERTLEPLWTRLDTLGILPGGADAAAQDPPDPVDWRDETDEANWTSDDSLEEELTDATTTSESDPVEETPATEAPGLQPYRPWDGRQLPDPRMIRTDRREEVLQGLLEIIETEGPICESHAYRIYAEAAGYLKLGARVRRQLVQTKQIALEKGLIEEDLQDDTAGFDDSVLRAPGTPAVRVRPPGPRSFKEVPAREMRGYAEHLLGLGGIENLEDLERRTLEFYGLRRLTERIRSQLDDLLGDLMEPPEEADTETAELDPIPNAEPTAGPASTWIEDLLDAPLLEEQQLSARLPSIRHAELRRLLVELDRSGGSMTPAALSRALGLPRFRLDGFLSHAQRVLNIDSCEALRYDRDSEVVSLDTTLLVEQFRL